MLTHSKKYIELLNEEDAALVLQTDGLSYVIGDVENVNARFLYGLQYRSETEPAWIDELYDWFITNDSKVHEHMMAEIKRRNIV